MNILQRIIEFILQLLGNQTQEKTPAQPEKPSPTQPEKPVISEQGIPFDDLKKLAQIKPVSDLPLSNPPAQNISAPEWFTVNPKGVQPIPFDPIKES